MEYNYLIALGSNVRHRRFGAPRSVVSAALAALDHDPLGVKLASPIIDSAPLGPSARRYANAAALITTRLDPPELLDHLKMIERSFGRRKGGRRWGARVLDLDIVLWSGGAYAAPGLIVPHPQFRQRSFVLAPAVRIAAKWRDPLTGLTVRHLHVRLSRRLTRPHSLP